MKRIVILQDNWCGFDLHTGNGFSTYAGISPRLGRALGGVGRYRVVITPRGKFQFKPSFDGSIYFTLYRNGRKVRTESEFCGGTLSEYNLVGYDDDYADGPRFNVRKVR